MKEKKIYFTKHAKKRMEERNVKEEEIIFSIRNKNWEIAREGKFSVSEVFPFNNHHYGRYYKWKEVVCIFEEEEDKIVVITVYSFFFQRR